jgi:hypothetical protein
MKNHIIKSIVGIAAIVFGLSLSAGMARADIIHADDVIINGMSLCVGADCVNGEAFGFDTIRLKENNLRIDFLDTSNSASFPNRRWRIIVNDSANGGLNRFSIQDVTGSAIPFTIEAGAPTNSLYVDDGGRLGLGTSTPVVDVHIKSGNTPTLRLEQDGSSGFTPQTWDVAGNEANFFIRDATNGSTLPFRIFPGAPSNALNIQATTGNVGMGTTSPGAALHVTENLADFGPTILLENTNAINFVGFRLTTSGGNIDFNNTNGEFRLNFDDDDNQELALTADGNLTIDGDLTTSTTTYPDYVFEPGYKLLSLVEVASYIKNNGHLPNIPVANMTDKGMKVNVSKLQLKLLEKIEELTLYTLQQEERINTQEEKINALEAKNKE